MQKRRAYNNPAPVHPSPGSFLIVAEVEPGRPIQVARELSIFVLDEYSYPLLERLAHVVRRADRFLEISLV